MEKTSTTRPSARRRRSRSPPRHPLPTQPPTPQPTTPLPSRTTLTRASRPAAPTRIRPAPGWRPPGFCPRSEVAVCTDLQNHFPSRVVVVDRLTQPEIGAPLGWVMSEASFTSLDVAMVQGQLRTECAANTPRTSGAYAPVQADRETQPSCRTGYATLGDLVRYYNTPS